ncbi:MAG: hypothetical protein AXW17_02285 [Colwellia sp. Phe_37]|nr:MAG: hypothetical protein AXW17_02285 [Colwellia sp. Phe_37]
MFDIFTSIKRRFNTSFWRFRLAHSGVNTVFDLDVKIFNPTNVSIGRKCNINSGVIIQSCEGAKIIIKDNVTLSYNCMLLTGGLVLDNKLANKAHLSKDILINDDVWIGANSIILPGISLGKGCVIAAGSVVTKNVDDNVIVAGNPAKFIKAKV